MRFLDDLRQDVRYSVRMSGDGPKRLLVALATLVTGFSSPALAAEDPDQRWGASIRGEDGIARGLAGWRQRKRLSA